MKEQDTACKNWNKPHWLAQLPSNCHFKIQSIQNECPAMKQNEHFATSEINLIAQTGGNTNNLSTSRHTLHFKSCINVQLCYTIDVY